MEAEGEDPAAIAVLQFILQQTPPPPGCLDVPRLLKILREKVLEDEQKSGIGNLYDDDKTSHQHITLLKTKYA